MARIVYDLKPVIDEATGVETIPSPGDGLVSVKRNGDTGSWYAILAVREVKQRALRPFRRWVLTCERVDVIESAAGLVWPIRWYRRGERP